MKKDALYRLVSELKITKQKVLNIVYYCRLEADAAMGVNPELALEYYSIQLFLNLSRICPKNFQVLWRSCRFFIVTLPMQMKTFLPEPNDL